MQSIPYCLRAATKRSMYLAPPPKVASGPSCREIWPTLVKCQKVEISLNKTCICPCFGGFLMLNSLPWVRPPRPGWALTPEWLLPWSGSGSGSRHSGWSTWWTWGSQGRWRQRQCHRQTAGWGRAQCPGRRRRPGPRTARCCRSPALWSLARSTHKQSLFCGGLWESPGGKGDSGPWSLNGKTIKELKRYFLTLAENSNCVVKGHRFDVQGGKNGFFVRQGWVLVGRNLTHTSHTIGS